MTAPLYISVAAVRAVGISNPPYDDTAVEAAIRYGMAVVERACRQWFYAKDCVFQLDGTDSDALFMAVPIISVSELRLNGSSEAMDPDYYKVYTDPRNPSIKLVPDSADRDIFTATTSSQLKFRRGRQNQYVAGSFGYLEDGATPLLIQHAVLILAVEYLTQPVYVNPSAPPLPPPPPILGQIVEEGTDGHYAKYAQVGGALKPTRPSAWAGLTNNPKVIGIIKTYRAPIGIAAPADPSFMR